MNRKELIYKVREIETFSKAFQVIFKQNKEPYPSMQSDWLQGLQFYLHGYAYERQGRSPEYSLAAVKAVEEARLINLKKPDSEFPSRAWAAFLQILRLPISGQGANPYNNPLFHKNNNTVNESVTSLILKLDDCDYNLIKKVEALLKQYGVEAAHIFLCRIRGTGNKINSLFLRDIVLMCNLAIGQDHPLLQPVDIWVRRLIRLLMGFSADVPNGEKDVYSSDINIAKTIIDLSTEAGVSPLKFNQGAWYFGAEIAGTKAHLTRYVESKLSASDSVNQKLRLLEEQTQALRNLFPQC